MNTKKQLISKKIFESHAEICKTLANPKRLEILNIVGEREISVNAIAKTANIAKANVSQHLSVLKLQGVVIARREGRNTYYKISSPKIITACNLMREVLTEKLKREEKILEDIDNIKRG